MQTSSNIIGSMSNRMPQQTLTAAAIVCNLQNRANSRKSGSDVSNKEKKRKMSDSNVKIKGLSSNTVTAGTTL
jgi:hypothetical protein